MLIRRSTPNVFSIFLSFIRVIRVIRGDSLLVRGLSEALFFVEVAQGLDQFAEVAGDDGAELVQVQVDAVIRDAVLWEVVSADALAAVAGADQRAALLGPFAVQFLLPHFVDPAAQDTQGTIVVLVLAALVLALDFQLVRRAALVPDAHGAFRFVDVLAARAAGAHAFPFDVLIADFDLHLVRLGQHGHGGGGGVDAALLLRLGHTLHAMPAALVAQETEGVVAGDAEHNFLVAALLAGAEGDVLDLPAVVPREVRVHAVEVAGE